MVQLVLLAHPQVRQEILAAPLHQLLVGQTLVALALEAVPNIQIGKEIGLLVGKTLVRLGGGIARFQRPLARVLNRQRGRDHQYFRHAVVFLRRQQNACDFRVDKAGAPFVRRVWSGGSGEGRRYCLKRFEGRLKRFCRLSDCVGHECPIHSLFNFSF